MLTSIDVRTGLAFTPIGMLLCLRDELAEAIADNPSAPTFSLADGVGPRARLVTVDDEIERRAAAWFHLTAGSVHAAWHGGWRGTTGHWRRRRGLLTGEITGIRVGGAVRLRAWISGPSCRPDLLPSSPRVLADIGAPFWRASVAALEAQRAVDEAIDEACRINPVAISRTVDDLTPSDLRRVFTLTVRPLASRAYTGLDAATVVPTLVLGANGDGVWPLDPCHLPEDTPDELRPRAVDRRLHPLERCSGARRDELAAWCLEAASREPLAA